MHRMPSVARRGTRTRWRFAGAGSGVAGGPASPPGVVVESVCMVVASSREAGEAAVPREGARLGPPRDHGDHGPPRPHPDGARLAQPPSRRRVCPIRETTRLTAVTRY